MVTKLTSTSRIWKAGDSTVITVPTNIRRLLGLEVGDSVMIDWGEVIKREEMSNMGLKEIEEHKEKTKKDKIKLNETKLPEI